MRQIGPCGPLGAQSIRRKLRAKPDPRYMYGGTGQDPFAPACVCARDYICLILDPTCEPRDTATYS